ncbi:MAG: hypothetical protein H6Q89_3523 [Myxococcaceae bacterium]|nr:hypothetical protein [Myxococcaceae bacterium]
MKTRLLILALLGGLGCGHPPSYCENVCAKLRTQLVRDFGVLENNVVCSDQKFVEADTCPKCQALFTRDYAVLFTSGCDDGVVPEYVEPRPH